MSVNVVLFVWIGTHENYDRAADALIVYWIRLAPKANLCRCRDVCNYRKEKLRRTQQNLVDAGSSWNFEHCTCNHETEHE